MFLESNGGPDETIGEVMLFTSFALRQAMNLGGQYGSMLGHLLSFPGQSLREIVNHESPDGARLVTYQGAAGRKQFHASLSCTDSDFSFNLKAKGFGLLARGVGYYAPNAVVVLLKYLSRRRLENAEYIAILETATAMCGDGISSGRVTLRNQGQMAFTIANLAKKIVTEKSEDG